MFRIVVYAINYERYADCVVFALLSHQILILLPFICLLNWLSTG